MALVRVADTVCIYWKLEEGSGQTYVPGYCTAGSYFSPTLISCYNDKQCDGAGTCRGCSAYSTGGLAFTQKDTTGRYGAEYVWLWDTKQEKYLPLRKTGPEEAVPESSSDTTGLTHTQKTTSYNWAAEQTPMNLAIYNLRAKFKKCCNWDGSPFNYSMSRSGVLYATAYYGNQTRTVPYLSKDESGDYIYLAGLNACSLGATTASWTTPFTIENQYAYGCNGVKPECPHYTGPTWTYCVDSKMEFGDRISASQIMELRYYSANWKSMSDPKWEWNKRFKDPVIWAWTGDYDNDAGDDPDNEDNPIVQRVHVESFDTEEPQIVIDGGERSDVGLPTVYTSTNFPTAVKELSSSGGGLEIVWPMSTYTEPYIHRTFRIGQNKVFVVVSTAYSSAVYAVNLSKHEQGAATNYDFVQRMLTEYPEDITEGQTADFNGLVVVEVELEYYPKRNQIKIFTRDLTSNTGEYLTDEVTIIHQFAHAVVMQTKGEDRAGQRDIKPYIDRFENVYMEADIRVLQGPLEVNQLLWDSATGNKITTYPIYEIKQAEVMSTWYTLGCGAIAVYFDDWRCNPIHPWELSGEYDGISLGLLLDRTANEAASETTLLLDVVYKSNNGVGFPADVVLVKVPGKLSVALDPTKDIIYASYRVTEYKQCPVAPEDRTRLKIPGYEQHYATELPLAITLNEEKDSFTVEGSFLNVSRSAVGPSSEAETDRIYNLNEVQDEIALRLKGNEDKAVFGFPTGGVQDSQIESSVSIFNDVRDKFEAKYFGYTFADNKAVTLKNTCDKLEDIKTHEGEYKFLIIFKDERGKPIGVKRVYLMLQSAHVECRDVEIYYEWNMNLRPWYINNSISLLAMHSEPMERGELEGIEVYKPNCGDHSETLLAPHTQGDPGPLWFPYNICRIPEYHEDHPNALVKCSNYVEGFDDSSSTRWGYWERMRGPDRMYTWIAGTIRLVGCFYREVSYSYTTEGAQNFSGYTRIRSAHPAGPFAKDREAIHINRHFIKRNLKVRQEYVKREGEQDDISVQWTDGFSQIAFTPGGAEYVGSQSESPIWVHLADGMSVVNRTSTAVQHPFTHYLLKSSGGYQYNETFSTVRLKIKDVLSERDLTSTAVRNTNGTLVFKPGEALSSDAKQNYGDLYPVFSDKNISWAWLERPKDPIRGAFPVTGITLYPPRDYTPPGQSTSIPALKQDRELAAYTEEGSHKLVYTPPVFDAEGTLTAFPTFSFAGGPERLLNWYTGDWVDENTLYDPTYYENSQSKYKDKFYMFGKGSSGSSMLIDSTGTHQFIGAVTNDGPEYFYTVRGVGVSSKVVPQDLPYSSNDYMYADPNARLDLRDIIDNKLIKGKDASLTINMYGYYYIDEIKITFLFGTQDIEGSIYTVRHDIPVTNISIRDINGVVLTASTEYEQSSIVDLENTDTADGSIYTYEGVTYKQKKFAVGRFASAVKLDFSSIRGDAIVDIEKLEIIYRRPERREEDVYVYERKLNVSTAESGLPDYRNLLYYYSRTIPDFGYSLTNQFSSSDSSYPSIKWVNKNAKDVILEYEYTDPTNTRFAYKEEVKPEAQPGVVEHSDLSRSYSDSINICTKSRTLFATSHVDDCPQYVTEGGDVVVNSENVATNETASLSCTSNVGNEQLDETLQGCLYKEAKELASTLTSEYTWFWHPDEIDFWENIVRIPITHITTTLTLSSVVAPMHKLWEHEHFGCSSDLATPYHDGRLHPIDPWQAAGHRVYTGNPAFNETCVNVVVFKIGEHVGEENWGSPEYTELKGGTSWPYMTYKDAAFYIDSGNIEKRGTYMGGTVGGAGLDFWVQQSQFSHGFTEPQVLDERELEESIIQSRTQATAAEGSTTNFHYDQ